MCLVHLLDESIDVVLTVSEVTTFDVMTELSCAEATSWVGELEWPQEVVDLLEVGADGEDFVDDIFNADYTKLSEFCLNDGIVCESNTLLVTAKMLVSTSE
jgi:hypothetical protein